MPRKNFGGTVGTTSAVLVTANTSPAETITIRTITACNRSATPTDAWVTIGYRDASASLDVYIAWRHKLRALAGSSSSMTFDIGQVLEPGDYLFALAESASNIDVTGSYEV